MCFEKKSEQCTFSQLKTENYWYPFDSTGRDVYLLLEGCLLQQRQGWMEVEQQQNRRNDVRHRCEALYLII